MNSICFSSLPQVAQAALARTSSALSGVVPVEVNSWRVDVASLPLEVEELQLLVDVKRWAGKSKLCLYYFSCANREIDLSKVQRAFADAKAHESNDRAYARLNACSACFYVGSSQSIAKRLIEHLGYGSAGTYALQLLHWARPLGLELEFVCAKYPDGTDYSIVQSLEDALWESKTPMFGRQGRK